MVIRIIHIAFNSTERLKFELNFLCPTIAKVGIVRNVNKTIYAQNTL